MKDGSLLCKNFTICCIKWNIIEVLFSIFSTPMSSLATIIAHKVDHFEELNVFHIFDKAREALNRLYKNMKESNEFDTLAIAVEALNNAELDLLNVMRTNRALAQRRSVPKRSRCQKRWL